MILKELKIDTWVGDPTNCYIIFDEDSKEVMCIDPAGDVDKIEYMIKDILHGELKYIYLTHCHGDHIGGVTELKNRCGGKILIHRFDSDGLNDANINLSTIIDLPKIELEADSRVDDGDKIHLGKFRVFSYSYTWSYKRFNESYIVKRKDVYFQEIHYLEAHGEEQIYLHLVEKQLWILL